MTETAQSTAQSLANEARAQVSDAVKPAVEQARAVAEQQRAIGASKTRAVANAVRKAADDLEPQLPVAASYIRSAADRLQQASSAIERRNIDELVDVVSDAARNQPAAVFGAAAVAGFALSRFLKSSGGRTHGLRSPGGA